jgi:uncharacterized protein (TIGR02266 family)
MTVRLRAVYEHAGETCEATATTLGAGGLFIACESPPPTGSTLCVRFQVPGGTRELALAARVVWRHRPGDPGAQTHGMGVAFTSPADCAALATQLEALASAEGARSEP